MPPSGEHGSMAEEKENGKSSAGLGWLAHGPEAGDPFPVTNGLRSGLGGSRTGGGRSPKFSEGCRRGGRCWL